MISITAFRHNGSYRGFTCLGHADSTAEDQYDPICDAVSILVINTVNSIEEFCTKNVHEFADENEGRIEFRLLDEPTEQTDLLIKSLIFGIKMIIEQNGDRYVSLTEKEE